VGDLKPLSIFYGYPDFLIAQWCGVSVVTARGWKLGKGKPSRQSLRLFTLYRDEKVLGTEWRGVRIQGKRLVDSAGMSLTFAQIEQYQILLQWAAELARRDPADRARFQWLLDAIGKSA
jgi:hypothetical protein